MRPHPTPAPCRRHPWRAASLAAASVLALGWITGCSVLYDLSTDQCKVDADCVALGGSFETLACVDNLCQEPPITGCQSNSECIDEQGGGLQAWACIERECVKLETPECPIVLPQTDDLWLQNLRTNNPVILAGTGLIGGTNNFDLFLQNYDLALTELTRINSGLPSGRQVVMLGCQALFSADPEALDREMEHLANKVKVPGIVSAFGAADLQRAFTDYGKAAQMFFMSPLDSDPTLAAIQDDGLIWHLLPSPDWVARPYAPLLTRTLAFLGVTTDAKVATVVTSDDRALTAFRDTIEGPPAQFGLTFNGKTVTQNLVSGDYLTVNITSSEEDSVVEQVDQIIDLLPNVIVSTAGREFVRRMIPAIEAGWPVSDPPVGTDPPKPFYLLSPANYNDPALLTVLESNSGLSRRLAGVNYAAAVDSREYDAYVRRWLAAFPGSRLGYENFYDAAYYLLYATAGAGANLTNGQSLFTGMNRLLSGAGPYNVGPEDMPAAMSTLVPAVGTIQLNGTLGPPDFNRVNGTRESPGSVWCVDATRQFRPDVLLYQPGPGDDATGAQLVAGASNFCFAGF